MHLLGLIIFGHEVSEMVSVVPRCHHQQSQYDSGLELAIASTSVTEVGSSSYMILVFPIVFFKHLLVALTILSKTPPHQGALGKLNDHSIRCSATLGARAYPHTQFVSCSRQLVIQMGHKK